MRNQVQPVTESRNFFPFNSTRSELIAMLLGLILVSAGLVLILRPSPPTLPNVMPLPHGITPVKPSLFERIVPLSWGWLWRFRELLLGRHKTVLLKMWVMDCAGISATAPPDFSLPPAHYTDTNGLWIWILRDAELAALRRRLEQSGQEVLFRPNIQTAHEVHASMSVTTTINIDGTPTPIGLSAEVLPRVRKEAIDLCALFTQTVTLTNQDAGALKNAAVSAHTNFHVGARMQIPKGSGVFLLDRGKTGTNPSLIGVIIEANQPGSKK